MWYGSGLIIILTYADSSGGSTPPIGPEDIATEGGIDISTESSIDIATET